MIIPQLSLLKAFKQSIRQGQTYMHDTLNTGPLLACVGQSLQSESLAFDFVLRSEGTRSEVSPLPSHRCSLWQRPSQLLAPLCPNTEEYSI